MVHFASRDETAILLENSAADFLRQRFDPQRLRAQYDQRNSYDRAFWRELAMQGWLTVRLPEEQGGSGLGAGHVAVLAHSFGRFAMPDPFVACALMPAVLAAASDRPTWTAIIDGLTSGNCISTLAWQENPHVLEPGLPATLARAKNGGFRLDGDKCQVVGGDWADLLLVTATLDGEAALFAVPRTHAGMEVATCLTSDGGTLSTLRLQGVQLQETALLSRGQACLDALQLALDEALLATSAQLLGLASRAFELTLQYMRTRLQFGRAIGSFQVMQHMAVDVRTRLALAGAACGAAVRLHQALPGSARAREAVAAAKARCSDTALLAGRFGVQAHGAIGFASEADIGVYLKSAIRLAAYLGNGSHHRRRVANMATDVGLTKEET